MEKKHLSEVLSANELLAIPNNRICVLAGVGAGKNYFVTNELRGHGNIFFVSSRRATVNQMLLLEEICKEKVEWSKFNDEVFATTNYGVEQLVKNKRFSSTGIKNIIEHFDIIVIDEFHSLKADATFANSSFHLHCFLNYISKNYPYKKIIVMTGTEEPVQDILRRDNYTIIDKRNECINVLPKNIEVIRRKEAIELIRKLPTNQKTIYYTNSATGSVSKVKNRKSLYESLCENNGYKTKEIAFAMADDSAEKIMLSKHKTIKKGHHLGHLAEKEVASENTKDSHIEDLNRKVKLLKRYVIKKEKLPQSTKVLIATSTFKEGINIKSTDIKVAFCESHVLSDIQQFAGRVRAGLDTLYIIYDADQFDVTEEEQRENYLEVLFSSKTLKNINDFLHNQVKNEGSTLYHKGFGNFDAGEIIVYNSFLYGDWSIYGVSDAAKSFIDMVEKSFRYIRYNHLEARFELFASAYREQMRLYDYFAYGWEKAVSEFCHNSGIAYKNNCETKPVDIDELNSFMASVLDIKLVGKEKDEFISTLSKKLRLNSSSPNYKTLRTALSENKVTYSIIDGYTKRNGKSVRYCMVITEKNKQKNKSDE